MMNEKKRNDVPAAENILVKSMKEYFVQHVWINSINIIMGETGQKSKNKFCPIDTFLGIFYSLYQ